MVILIIGSALLDPFSDVVYNMSRREGYFHNFQSQHKWRTIRRPHLFHEEALVIAVSLSSPRYCPEGENVENACTINVLRHLHMKFRKWRHYVCQ